MPALPTEALTTYALPPVNPHDELEIPDHVVDAMLVAPDTPDGDAPVVRGRVVAADATTGALRMRSGTHLLTVTLPLADVDRVRVGQLVTVALKAA
jgi:hypothetical protein